MNNLEGQAADLGIQCSFWSHFVSFIPMAYLHFDSAGLSAGSPEAFMAQGKDKADQENKVKGDCSELCCPG